MHISSARLAALLKEYGWGLNLLFIALGAYFVAGAANAVLARSIRVVPKVDEAAAVSPKSFAPSSRSVSYTDIAERNLFGIKREELNPQTVTEAAADTPLLGDEYRESDLRPCTVPATLRATLVADSAPEWSMAVVVSNTTKDPEVYTINVGNNQLADDAAIVDIRPREIVVRRRDHFELCTTEGEERALSAAPTLASTTVQEPGSTSGGGEGVTKVSETQYEIEGGEIDRALGNLNEVATQARIVPSFQNGKADGFKLFSIKPGSIYSKIGLQNGDVIRKINGYEINSPDKALEIYQKLRDASSVQIELKRRGREMNLGYSIKR